MSCSMLDLILDGTGSTYGTPRTVDGVVMGVVMAAVSCPKHGLHVPLDTIKIQNANTPSL